MSRPQTLIEHCRTRAWFGCVNPISYNRLVGLQILGLRPGCRVCAMTARRILAREIAALSSEHIATNTAACCEAAPLARCNHQRPSSGLFVSTADIRPDHTYCGYSQASHHAYTNKTDTALQRDPGCQHGTRTPFDRSHLRPIIGTIFPRFWNHYAFRPPIPLFPVCFSVCFTVCFVMCQAVCPF